MGFRYRKSINLGGGFRTTFSKSGAGFSWGTKGFRVTKKVGGGTRSTISIPGTGISHVSNSKSRTGCLEIIIVWPLKLCCWILLGMLWLMWKMLYWAVALCFILPIKLFVRLIKNKDQPSSAKPDTKIDSKQ